jgi:post-segregation antitoxin (ccd killing protein)
MNEQNLNKNHRLKPQKRTQKTVGITLPLSLVEEAQKHNLDISRICEQALQSVLEYMEAQKIHAPQKQALSSFGETFLQRKNGVPRAGFELKSDGEISRESPLFLFLNI